MGLALFCVICQKQGQYTIKKEILEKSAIIGIIESKFKSAVFEQKGDDREYEA